jgi:hypothetical protein
MLSPNSDVAIVPKKRNAFLPLLVVLFLVSYGLMATLVVEQARTIDTQRSLILNLFSDSGQLTALKMKLLHEQQVKNGVAAKAQPGAQAPSAVKPNAPQAQAPNNVPQSDTKKSSVTARMRKAAPEKPPSMSADSPDVRRTLLGI